MRINAFAKGCLTHPVVWLLLFWLVASTFNVRKAIHMDDTVYLTAARNIVTDPLHPFSGTINWVGGEQRPFERVNQPPLFFYAIGAAFKLFGESEILAHIVLALFSLGAIVSFFLLIKLFTDRYALLVTALFCLSPAFIPSQNIMTDIPALACFTACLYLLLVPTEPRKQRRIYMLAGFVAGCGILIKYTGLILLGVMLVAICFRKHWRFIWTLLIPLSMIGAWSLLNIYDYGGVHVAQRPVSLDNTGKIWRLSIDWIVCIGALSPFSIMFLPWLLRRKKVSCALLLIICVLSFFAWPHVSGPSQQQLFKVTLFTRLFWLNGVLVLLATAFLYGEKLLANLRKFGSAAIEQSRSELVLLAALFGSFLFIVLFSRFMAMRHVLYVLPVILVALALSVEENHSKFFNTIGLCLTLGLGSLLGISDWHYSDLYRVNASKLRAELGEQNDVWALGHWGWQWYAEKAGMKIYSWDSEFVEDEYVIVTKFAHRQELLPEHQARLQLVKEVTVTGGVQTLFRTMSGIPGGGYYVSGWHIPPWRIDRGPLEIFSIYRVQKTPTGSVSLPIKIEMGQRMDLRIGKLVGFHEREYWGRWSRQGTAGVEFAVPLPRKIILKLTARMRGATAGKPLQILAGDAKKQILLTDAFEEKIISLESSKPISAIYFEVSTIGAQMVSGINVDARPLGVAIARFTISADTSLLSNVVQ